METLALILAGGRGSRLDILSEKRSKPAVPFAGKFRIIDFALSNCTNSGIYQIGILTQYLPLSLNEHIGVGKPWDLDRRDSFVTLLQPNNSWYEGTADAIRKNLEFIKIAIVFYDSNGNAVGYDTKYAECQVNGSVDYMSFDFPYDDDYEIIFPSSYKIYVNTAHDWN